MAEHLTANVENSFLSRARYPKGKKRLQAILDATYDIVISQGLAAASQEAIAKRANVTQSAVRHYFPTKDELLFAFFATGVERLQQLLQAKMAETEKDPRVQLLESASLHYDRMLEVEDVYFFEAAAFWGRNPDFRDMRDTWYQTLERHYVSLIERIHPEWDKTQSTAASFQVLTLILGGWVTMGSSRPFYRRRSRKSLNLMLLRGIERLIE
ncbi:MAG: TetR/AcrR family transcriptional regulator [Pseudomonadales bacterium]